MMKLWRDLKETIEHEGDVSEDASEVFITKRQRKLLSCQLTPRSHL